MVGTAPMRLPSSGLNDSSSVAWAGAEMCGARWPGGAGGQLPWAGILSVAAASAADSVEPLAQRGLLAVLGELEKALANGLVGHQLLLGHSPGMRMRVVVVEPAPELLGARVGRAPERRRRLGRAVLADPGPRPLDRLVGGVRL